ncbi:MAG TPA: phage portal protein [Candidatus Ventrousia excrementavium]|uniref:Phage portal protein n=1 Tax=Candidatus Ventrousia excrementavium TaxID=2840961 RepID=A0A9D1IX98_9CLOT|nr:phage portal protein [Candidatus Ventrousia excrementavium]
MSRLSAFLNPVPAQQEKEVVISDRFVDENGNVVPFKIRALTQEENEALVKRSRHMRRIDGQWQEKLDNMELSRRTVVAATVEPDFSSQEMCDAYGVLDPLMVPGKMLLSGEYARLMQEITDLSGFDADIGEEAKN